MPKTPNGTTEQDDEAFAAFMAQLMGGESTEGPSQYLADVLKATNKVIAANPGTETATGPQIAGILVAVAHSVASNSHKDALTQIAKANIPWADVTNNLVTQGLLTSDEAQTFTTYVDTE